MPHHPSQNPRLRLRMLSYEERQHFTKLMPHLAALISLEYYPTHQQEWPLKCAYCGATSQSPVPHIDRYHLEDCAWRRAWRLYPPPYLAEFERQWQDLPVEEQLKIRGINPRKTS